MRDDGPAPPPATPRALPPRLDARRRRRVRLHDLNGVAAARRARARGGRDAHRARRPPRAADARPAAPRRPRRDHPRCPRGPAPPPPPPPPPRAHLAPGGEPAGTVRVAGFATAVRRSLVPVLARLSAEHPAVRLRIHEHEPAEALELLAADEIDLALVYDYTLAPATLDPALRVTPLWTAAWELGVRAADAATGQTAQDDAPAVFRRFAGAGWIVNARNVADEQVVRTIASLAGFEPRVAHRADSLELVQDLIIAKPGVGLPPAEGRLVGGVRLVALPARTSRCA